MSMEHKAFVFDYAAFERELRPTLLRALASGESADLVRFIDRAQCEFSDPYEGRPLRDDWQGALSNRDVHEYGDYALTKYYDPACDIGLSYDWQEVALELESHGLSEMILLGSALESGGRVFDPGRMGSYVQSAVQVVANLDRVTAAISHIVATERALVRVRDMLALAREQGLYVTF